MRRFIVEQLQVWRQKAGRKPLVLLGVRQCGKTHSLEHFGASEFPVVHYINFEASPSMAEVFAGDLTPCDLIAQLSFRLQKQINPKTDCLILDEIQVCPRALTSLKYFAEKMPELAVCTAGSLLGVGLNSESFPVGKIDLMHCQPMNFSEFLLALGHQQAFEYLQQLNHQTKIPPAIHQVLWERLLQYFVTGGLPEVVKVFCDHQDNLYQACQLAREKQNTLIYTYYADIAKYAGAVNALHIDRVWRSVPDQLSRVQDGSSKRFQFKGVVAGVDRYDRLAGAIDWLIAANLVIKVPLVNQAELPLSAYTKESQFKLFCFDVGILGAMANIPPVAILDYNYGTYKGYFAENYIARALAPQFDLYSWQDNRHEIEFTTQINADIIPIEVKSGTVVKAQSLAKYTEKYHPKYRTVFSGRNLQLDLDNHLHQYPLYCADRFPLAFG